MLPEGAQLIIRELTLTPAGYVSSRYIGCVGTF